MPLRQSSSLIRTGVAQRLSFQVLIHFPILNFNLLPERPRLLRIGPERALIAQPDRTNEEVITRPMLSYQNPLPSCLAQEIFGLVFVPATEGDAQETNSRRSTPEELTQSFWSRDAGACIWGADLLRGGHLPSDWL